MYFDTHCHIQGEYLRGRALSQVLKNAKDAHLSGLVCVGTDPISSEQAAHLASSRQARDSGVKIYYSVGVHPHEGMKGLAELERILTERASDERLVAVGECGLDFYYENSPRQEQLEAFSIQLELAKRHDLAAIVHLREAFNEAASILKDLAPPRVVIHCFTGGPEELKTFLSLGCFISFSGIVTFKKAEHVRAAASLCPIERMVAETDSPFLAPEPKRGSLNEPANVVHVIERLGKIKGIATEDLGELLTKNARALFRI